MSPDDPFQLWSFKDDEIVRLVGADFCVTLRDIQRPDQVLSYHEHRETGVYSDLRDAYYEAEKHWRRIA